MTCTEFLQRYSDYDDSLLSPEEHAAFRAHLAVCASCARYDRVLRKGRMLARQLPQPEPSPEFFPDLHRRVAEARQQRHDARVGVTGTLAAATVVLAAVGGLALLRSPEGAPQPGGTVAPILGYGWTTASGGPSVDPVEFGEPPLAGRDPGGTLDRAAPDVFGIDPWAAPVPVVTIVPGVEGVPESESWTAVRVDPALRPSYSPLVTGPPLYRLPARGFTVRATTSTRSAFD